MSAWKKLLDKTADVPRAIQILTALGAVLVVVIPGLGLIFHRSRMEFLRLPADVVEYATTELAMTGLAVVWRIPWRMLLGVGETSTPQVFACWALVLCCAGLIWGSAIYPLPGR